MKKWLFWMYFDQSILLLDVKITILDAFMTAISFFGCKNAGKKFLRVTKRENTFYPLSIPLSMVSKPVIYSQKFLCLILTGHI